MKLRTFAYFAREAFYSLIRNSLMSLTAIGIIVVTLIIMGVFYIVYKNVGHYITLLKDSVDIKLFLDKEIGPTEIFLLKERILKIKGVEDVIYVSKEKGKEIRAEAFKMEDEELFFDENPLPDALHLKLKRDADIEYIEQSVRQYPGVAEVYAASTAKMFYLALQITWVSGVCILLLVFFAAMYIMVNTIRLTVLARRKEIEIMKLVGATDWFIRWPFIIEGLYLGLGGAFLAVFLLSRGYISLAGKIHQIAAFIPLVQENIINAGLCTWLISMGIVIGLAGSFLSVKKFLKV